MFSLIIVYFMIVGTQSQCQSGYTYCVYWQSTCSVTVTDARAVTIGFGLGSRWNYLTWNVVNDIVSKRCDTNPFGDPWVGTEKVCCYKTTVIPYPTRAPTLVPTNAPSIKNCDDSNEINKINWNYLQNSNGTAQEIPYYNFSMRFDKTTLELAFDIDLEYLGTSYDANSNKYGLGTTYIIDFQSFGTHQDRINKPGNCQNRLSSSFDGINDFDSYWTFSEYPYLQDQLGSDSYLSYPTPSEYWILSIGDDTCSPINYQGLFTWNDLTKCKDYDGNNLITVIDDNVTITLSGTIYVNIVSPYSMGAETGIYRSFPLIQQDFSISIKKQINVISSTGVDLFISSIIGIYEDEEDKSFELSVLTQSADYIELINPNIISTPLGTNAEIKSVTNSCLTSSSFTCGQIFTITMNQTEINCPPSDFSGVYEMVFTVNCRNGQEVCNTFINDNGGSNVALSVSSNFIDTTCKQKLYDVIFDGIMTFYDNEQFSQEHDNENGDNNYIIGQDTIYIQVEITFPDDGSGDNFNIFGVVIDNVFVCTADDGIDLTTNLNQQNGQNGACLSSQIDADGPYNIIINGVENTEYFTEIISSSGISNVVQFSFLTFDIGRTTMYVHVQLTLLLQNGSRRRLKLLQTNHGSNQIRHFLGATTIVSDQNILETTQAQLVDDYGDTAYSIGKISYLFLSIFCAYVAM